MRIYDSALRAIVPLEVPETVRIYTCGITPYDAAHIGHAAVYLTFDVLQRRLRELGHETWCVRNVTDVDDDILAKAAQLKVHYLDLAAAEMAKFDRDMAALGLLPSYSEPRATSAISEILSLIEDLLKLGYAYQTDGAVYFEASKSSNFGEISHYSRVEMLALAAERGGNPEDERKRDPLDFVLWQASKPDEPWWESRWGPGRPGWHIECSALAMRDLGPTVDIHGGGLDLLFPHHECESAQSQAATGLPFVKYWMHVGMVRLDGVKMSKSLGNLVFVGDLLKEWEPGVVRLAILANHYRTSWDWSDDLLIQAQKRLKLWRSSGSGEGGIQEVRSAIDNDLDLPSALEAADEAAGRGLGVSSAASLIGVDI